MALTDEMTERNEGPYRPWCVGFGSGDATGWPGTRLDRGRGVAHGWPPQPTEQQAQ